MKHGLPSLRSRLYVILFSFTLFSLVLGLHYLGAKEAQTLSLTETLLLPGDYWTMVQRDNYLFAIEDNVGLVIIDITNSAYPEIVATLSGITGYDIALEGDFIYINVGNALLIVDVSDPLNPIFVSSYSDFDYYNGYAPTVTDVVARGNVVYLSMNYWDRCYLQGTLVALDVSDPFNPNVVYEEMRSNGMGDLLTYENHLYVLWDSLMLIFDITEPDNPVPKLPHVFDYVHHSGAGGFFIREDQLFVDFFRYDSPCDGTYDAWFVLQNQDSNWQHFIEHVDERLNLEEYRDGYLYAGKYLDGLYLLTGHNFSQEMRIGDMKYVELQINGSFGYGLEADFGLIGLSTVRLFAEEVSVGAGVGDTLVYEDEVGRETQVTIGAGAVMPRTEVSYLPLPTVDAPLPDLWVGQAFDLAGYMPDDQQTLMAFQEPVTVTLPYTTGELVAGWQFMFWDDTKWVPAEDTCSTTSGQLLATSGQPPTANSQLQFSICSPGKYALFIVPYKTFFPVARHR